MNQTVTSELTVTSTSTAEKNWLTWAGSTRRAMVFVFMTLIFMLAARSIVDPDFWWHLKAGQYMVQTRSIPRVDIFSFGFLGREWVAHEWLSEVLMFLIYSPLGFGGLIFVFALIITATFWVVYKRIARRVRHPMIVGPALLLGALASAPTWGVRPQMFSFLFASIFIASLEAYARKPEARRVLLLVPLMVFWVNLHAGYAMGLAFILLMMAGLLVEQVSSSNRQWSKIWRTLYPLGAILSLCVLAVLVNPNGARLFSYPFETLKSPAMMKYIAEWHSPDFQQPMFQPLALLFCGLLCVMALSRRRVRLRDLLFLSATAWATLKSARNVPFFVLIAVPLLAEHLHYWLHSGKWSSWIKRPEKIEVGNSALLKVALNIFLLFGVPIFLAVQRVSRSSSNQSTVTAQVFPVQAANYMRATKLPQPMYNEYGWGGYLIWQLYPEYFVHIDGRADVFGDTFLEEFLKTHAGEGNWQNSLEKHGIRTVIVRSDAPVANLLRAKGDWRQVFDDSQAVIFVKQ
jgi:hypothetical protein